jgi:hypothetical protein
MAKNYSIPMSCLPFELLISRTTSTIRPTITSTVKNTINKKGLRNFLSDNVKNNEINFDCK